jgi:hypothetical protein
MFIDPELAYTESMEYYEELMKKAVEIAQQTPAEDSKEDNTDDEESEE